MASKQLLMSSWDFSAENQDGFLSQPFYSRVWRDTVNEVLVWALAAFPGLSGCTLFKIASGKGAPILFQMQFIIIICPYYTHLSVFQNILRKGLLFRSYLHSVKVLLRSQNLSAGALSFALSKMTVWMAWCEECKKERWGIYWNLPVIRTEVFTHFYIFCAVRIIWTLPLLLVAES